MRQASRPRAQRKMAPPTPTTTPMMVFVVCLLMPVLPPPLEGAALGMVVDTLEMVVVEPSAFVVVIMMVVVCTDGCDADALLVVCGLEPPPVVLCGGGADVDEVRCAEDVDVGGRAVVDVVGAAVVVSGGAVVVASPVAPIVIPRRGTSMANCRLPSALHSGCCAANLPCASCEAPRLTSSSWNILLDSMSM